MAELRENELRARSAEVELRFNGSNSAALVELRDDPVDAQQCGRGIFSIGPLGKRKPRLPSLLSPE